MKVIRDAEVRWGVLGVGNVCEVKSAPAMQIIQGSRLVAVMRRNKELAKDYAIRHGVSKWYGDADELIQDPAVNAIYIATPPHMHADLTRKPPRLANPYMWKNPWHAHIRNARP
jgi:predicted dehydrogenase